MSGLQDRGDGTANHDDVRDSANDNTDEYSFHATQPSVCDVATKDGDDIGEE